MSAPHVERVEGWDDWWGTSPCEACGKPMRGHEWADLDLLGFVINCSEETNNEA